jgi:hypothetical protein
MSPQRFFTRTGCEFSVTPKLLAWATMEGNSIIRGAMRSEKWWDSVAADGAGRRVIAAFFGPYAPDALTAHVSVFSHDFKRFERFTKLATSSRPEHRVTSPRFTTERGDFAMIPQQFFTNWWS